MEFTTKPFNISSLTNEEKGFMSKFGDGYSSHLMSSSRLRQLVPLEFPKDSSAKNRFTTDFGNLARLPNETIYMIFSEVPISNLFNLIKVNIYVKYLIESWQPFQEIMNHSPDGVRAMIATGAGWSWTATQLANVLFTTRCELCGQHGEILYLPKLKRCCFRCLSTDRRLLAVPDHYATNILLLSRSELATLPALFTIDQPKFWGQPSQRCWTFDYSSALELIEKKNQASPDELHSQEGLDLVLKSDIQFQPTGEKLDPKLQSKPRRFRGKPIHHRRRTSNADQFRIPRYVIHPPESSNTRHACSIELPAMTKVTNVLPNGHLSTKITTVQAKLCAGCAFYWNYHSSLPRNAHQMYPDDGSKTSPLMEHLKSCVYAHMYWCYLYPRNDPNNLTQAILMLRNYHSTISDPQRHPEVSFSTSKCRFEMIPTIFREFYFFYYAEWEKFFSTKLEWPEQPEPTANSLKVEKKEPDWFGDMWLSEETVSQAGWACARFTDARSLFQGYANSLVDRQNRSHTKQVVKLKVRGARFHTWGYEKM